MKNPILKSLIGFNRGIFTLPKIWQAWTGLLILVNLILPCFFLSTLEAKVVLMGFMASFILMLILFSSFGFVKLLGLGHTPWLLMVPFLALRLNEHPAGSPLYYWVLAVVIIDGLSLLMDGLDVIRYWKAGEVT